MHENWGVKLKSFSGDLSHPFDLSIKQSLRRLRQWKVSRSAIGFSWSQGACAQSVKIKFFEVAQGPVEARPSFLHPTRRRRRKVGYAPLPSITVSLASSRRPSNQNRLPTEPLGSTTGLRTK